MLVSLEMLVSHFPFHRLASVPVYFRVERQPYISYFFAEWYTSKGGICFTLEMGRFYVICEACELYLRKTAFNKDELAMALIWSYL